jgi:carboxypeptidase C (cathepsin A)
MGVPNEARTNVAELIGAGTGGSRYDGVGIGSDSTAFADSDTSLGTTVDTATGLTASVVNNTLTLVGTFTGNTATIREATAFESSQGDLLARQVISTVNVESSDTLEITWDVEVT